jgi:hypothetical protein
VCAGPGTVFVSVTVVVLPGAVTVVVSPGAVTVLGAVSFVRVVVAVGSAAECTAVFAFVAAVETACCAVPAPLDPQELRAQATDAPAASAIAILVASPALIASVDDWVPALQRATPTEMSASPPWLASPALDEPHSRAGPLSAASE